MDGSRGWSLGFDSDSLGWLHGCQRGVEGYDLGVYGVGDIGELLRC